MKSKKTNNRQNGFTLLFSVLVATLVVSIGASIISIALRQTILSGTSRESQYAFYAANTVLECAFYWDITDARVFPAPEDPDDQYDDSDSEASAVTCSGGNLLSGSGFDDPRPWDTDTSSDENRTTFYMEVGDQGSISPGADVKRCAQATVIKTLEGDGTVTTRIEAKGYNTCDLSNPRAVERGLVQEYRS